MARTIENSPKHFNERSVRIRNNRSLEDMSDFLPHWKGQSLLELLLELPEGSRVLTYDYIPHTSAIEEANINYQHLCFEAVSALDDSDDFLARNPDTYNCIIALHAYRKGSRNQFETLKKMYRALTVDGVALIDSIYMLKNPIIDNDGSALDLKKLEKWLNDNGYDAKLSSIRGSGKNFHMSLAIRKTAERPLLQLPLQLVTIPKFPKWNADYPKLLYIFDEKATK